MALLKVMPTRDAGDSQALVRRDSLIPLFPFPAFSCIHALTGIRGIAKAADGLHTGPSSIKQHYCTCCQDLKSHTVLSDYFQSLDWPWGLR